MNKFYPAVGDISTSENPNTINYYICLEDNGMTGSGTRYKFYSICINKQDKKVYDDTFRYYRQMGGMDSMREF